MEDFSNLSQYRDVMSEVVR